MAIPEHRTSAPPMEAEKVEVEVEVEGEEAEPKSFEQLLIELNRAIQEIVNYRQRKITTFHEAIGRRRGEEKAVALSDHYPLVEADDVQDTSTLTNYLLKVRALMMYEMLFTKRDENRDEMKEVSGLCAALQKSSKALNIDLNAALAAKRAY